MREFRKEVQGKLWRWRVWLDGKDVHTEHGFAHGTLQHLVNNASPKYKGESCEVTAQTTAATQATKLIREKLRSGFVEVDPESGTPLDKLEKASLEAWDKLPPTFRTFQKRQLNEPGRAEIEQFKAMIASDQTLIYYLPQGRQFSILITADRRCRIYSIRGGEYTRWVPHLVAAIERSPIPPRSLLTAYLSTGRIESDHELFFSKDREAVVNRQLAPRMRFNAVICDTFFWDGQDVISGRSWAKNKALGRRLWDRIEIPYVTHLRSLISTPFDEAKKYAERTEQPGLIVYDRLGIADPDHCYAFQGFEPLNSVWVWRRPLHGDFYLLYHYSVGGRTGIMHKRTRTAEKDPHPDSLLRVGKVGLYQAGPNGEPLCFGTCRHGFDRATQELIQGVASVNNGWVGKGRVRYIGYHEAAHSNVVSRLVDPYFVQFLPEDQTLARWRAQGLAPGLGIAQARELRGSSTPSSPQASAPDRTDPSDHQEPEEPR